MTDELVPFEVPGAPGRVFYRNAGRTRYRGLEVAGSGRIFGGVRFRAAYTVTDGRFRRFQVEGQELAGNRIPGLPEHFLEGVVRWEGRRPGGSEPFLEAAALYRSSIPVNDGNTETAGARGLLDLRGGWGSIDVGGMAWTPFFGITNLLDRRHVTSVAVNAFGGRYFEPGPPRSGYIGLRIDFGK
jgi:iron complex outermembrane receptor protein